MVAKEVMISEFRKPVNVVYRISVFPRTRMHGVNGVPMKRVLGELGRLYRPPKSFLQHDTPFQLLIATLLSARSTDVQINKITPALFRKYRGPEDFLRVPQEELELDIHSSGTFRIKAKHIRALSKVIVEEHGGKVPETMEELTRLPGIGRKTASIILYVAFGKTEGIAVDTHVFRLARRLGLSGGRTPEKVELDLMERTPRDQWGRINALFISHGRAVCTARGRKCGACVFKEDCPSSLVQGRTDLAAPRTRKVPG